MNGIQEQIVGRLAGEQNPSLTITEASLAMVWRDGTTSLYPWIWLRDHAHDEETLHPVTQQRQLFTASIDRTTLKASGAQIVASDLVVSWEGSSTPSVLPLSFLHKFRIPSRPRISAPVDPFLWDAAFINATPPTIEYDQVIATDQGVLDWLELTNKFGFSLVVGTPANYAATEALIRRISYIRETIFGGMWEFTADLSKADTAYTNLELRPHTDGTYSHDAPGAQMLHCLHFDGTGGESTMVDAFAIANRMRTQHRAAYETLCRVAIPGQYIGDGSHLMAERPVFRFDAAGQLLQVSFNNYDRAPFLLTEDEMIEFYDAITIFDRIANDRSMQWRHVLAPGEAMLFDNWRVLHGREAYTGVRRMCGAYLNHEDIESRARVVSAAD